MALNKWTPSIPPCHIHLTLHILLDRFFGTFPWVLLHAIGVGVAWIISRLDKLYWISSYYEVWWGFFLWHSVMTLVCHDTLIMLFWKYVHHMHEMSPHRGWYTMLERIFLPWWLHSPSMIVGDILLFWRWFGPFLRTLGFLVTLYSLETEWHPHDGIVPWWPLRFLFMIEGWDPLPLI